MHDDQSPLEDLTTIARIRRAAMLRFAEDGFRATTLKGIAEEAGVSVGLVQHHFGTKAHLYQVCTEHASASLRHQIEHLNTVDGPAVSPNHASSLYDGRSHTVRFMLRLLIEGAPEADVIFDAMAEGTQRFLTEARPDLFPEGSQTASDAGTLLLAMHLGPAVLQHQVQRRTGGELFDPPSASRMGLTILDIYLAMADWTTSEAGEQARAAVTAFLDDPATSRPTTDRSDP